MADSTINTKAFRSLSYGVYIISACNDGRFAGCVVNTFQQVTSTPARVSVAINKENATCAAVLESGQFEATVLDESVPMELIGTFGFKTSTEIDKFAAVAYELDPAGVPFVTEHAIAHVGARVIETVDAGTHYVIIGEVDCAEVLSNEPPMTYAYYHLVKGGKTPPKASSFEADANAEPASAADDAGAPASDDAAAPRYGWRCIICGYVVETDELPDDFVCPICGQGRDKFVRVEL